MSSAGLIAVTAVYLGAMAALPALIDRRRALARLALHPFTHALALGVYATSWTFYGSVGFADRYGFAFFAIGLGPTFACLAIPFLWQPLADLVERRRLQSVADLLAFRYQSQAAGPIVTLLLLAGLLPYLSLQLRAVSDSAAFLTGGQSEVGFAYVVLLGLFAGVVGVRYAEGASERPGLLGTLAVESLVKLVAIVAVGIGALAGFGVDRFAAHLTDNPAVLERLWDGVDNGPWAALLTVSFVAAFLLPRQFHVAFVAGPRGASLRHAMWMLPLLLLLLHAPLPILYIVGDATAQGVAPDRYVLAAVSSPTLRTIAFVGGVSASSAMVLVSTIALSGMVSTHLITPLRGPRGISRRRSVQLRRAVIVGLVLLGFGFHALLPRGGSLVDLGLLSFVAVLQFAPGVLGVLFWRRATARGLLWGLSGGFATWVVLNLMPAISGQATGLPDQFGFAGDPRSAAVWLSLGVNSLLFAAVSLSRAPTPAEDAAAASCMGGLGSGAPPASVTALRDRLAATLGTREADSEVRRALDELDLPGSERRPLALRRLRDTVEHNLAEIVGPLTARELVAPRDEDDDEAAGSVARQLRFVEERARRRRPGSDPVEQSLEAVRRYLSDVLAGLPVGLCAVDLMNEVLVWNRSLESLSGVEHEDANGHTLSELPPPWSTTFAELLSIPGDVPVERTVDVAGRERILRCQVARFDAGAVVVIEDLTERRAMREQLAHKDRLHAVGGLAAGVAHEIGNPLTGLMMVARNLQREPDADDAGERLELVVAEAERIDVILKSMLGFSRREGSMRRARLAPRDLVDDALRLVRLGERERDVDFAVEGEAGEAALVGARQPLTQVLVNLLTNARDVSPERGRVTVRIGANTDWVEVDVSDEGPGIADDHRRHVFEPFFTTKDPGKGTGLGLAVSFDIVDEHGGVLDFNSEVGAGTTFRLRLPRAAEARV